MSRLAWLFALALLGCSTPPVPAPADPNPLLIEVGRKEFARHCAACHGADAKGGGPVARTPLGSVSDKLVRLTGATLVGR